MIKLDETEQLIKDNLQNFIDGKFDNFSSDETRRLIEMSFIYNHTSFNDIDVVTFEYGKFKIKLKGLQDVIHTMYSPKEMVFSSIRNDETFKAALKQFLRDNKIDKILQ